MKVPLKLKIYRILKEANEPLHHSEILAQLEEDAGEKMSIRSIEEPLQQMASGIPKGFTIKRVTRGVYIIE